MKNLMSIALAMLVLVGCNSVNGKGKKTTIEGTIENVSQVVVNKMAPAEFTPLDTIDIVEGAFEISLDIQEEDFYTLFFDESARITLFVSPGEHIELEGIATGEFITYEVEGSKESAKMEWLNNLNVEMTNLLETLNGQVDAAQGTPEFDSILSTAQAQFNETVDAQARDVRSFVRENMSSPTSIFGLFHGAGGQTILNMNDDFPLFDSVQSALSASYPNHSFTTFLTEQVNLARGTAVGADAPNFTMEGTDGQMHNVSDYFGGYLLIDFWASWCRPCRAENPNIVAAYEKYHERGFDVLGISLDGLPQQTNPKDLWMEAIEADGLTWNHLSDLKGWQTIARESYNFESIPFSVLVDPNGKIVAKNLRGELLEAKLSELLGE